MNDCKKCPREHECGYAHKPCECLHQLNFVPKTVEQCVSSVSKPVSLNNEGSKRIDELADKMLNYIKKDRGDYAKMFDELYSVNNLSVGVDKASKGGDHSIMSLMVNLTTLKADGSSAKYNHLAEEIMSTLFQNIQFKDNFEMERLVGALTAAARSHASAAMIERSKR